MIDIDAKMKKVLVTEVTILKKTVPLSIHDEGGARFKVVGRRCCFVRSG